MAKPLLEGSLFHQRSRHASTFDTAAKGGRRECGCRHPVPLEYQFSLFGTQVRFPTFLYTSTSSQFTFTANEPPVLLNIFSSLILSVDFTLGVLTRVMIIRPSNRYPDNFLPNCSTVRMICRTASTRSDPFNSMKNACSPSITKSELPTLNFLAKI